ncbi:MAG: type II toxin-antitoxin system YhaV family toxin [Steroidobacteraceae bacterium]
MTVATAIDPPLVINGWSIFAHPHFLDTFGSLVAEVERLRAKDPKGYTARNTTKRLAAIVKLAFEAIPQGPTRPEYRQGTTLGDEYKHWFRAKFFQQYRLFFRYHRESRIIIYAWVNDEDTKRAYESGTDAYRTFRRMLKSGNPPDDWNDLLSQARRQNKRLRAAKAGK